MHTTEDIYGLIEDRRRQLGLSQAEVGIRAFGKADTSFIQNIKRGSSPSYAKLAALSEALDLEFYFGPRRSAAQTIEGFAEHAASLTSASIDGSTEALRHGYRTIPYHDICNGQRGTTPISLARSWIEERNLDIEALCWVIAADDRMAPMVSSGALCLVEQQRTLPEPPSITALRHQGQLVLAHATRPSGNDWMLDHTGPGRAIYVPGNLAKVTLPIGRVVATFTIIDTTKGD